MAVEVFMPKMSDHMEVGVILSWLSKEGERVERGQPILELETDKAAVELEAPESGYLKGIRAGVVAGANVPVGETIAFIAKTPEESVPVLPPLSEVSEEATIDAQIEPAQKQVEAGDGGPVRAAPAVRRIARELGVDLKQVRGSGSEGRVLEIDVHAYVAAQTPRAPQMPPVVATGQPIPALSVSPVARRMAQELGVDLSQVKPGISVDRITKEDVQAYLESAGTPETPAPTSADGEWLALSRAQMLTGQRMAESLRTAPQFALTTSADMTRLLELREAVMVSIEAETGARLSVTAIMVRFVADALKRFQRANATFVDGRIKLHAQINIGVAVGTDEELVVPVIHEADKKSLSEISQEMKSLQEKARRMRFGPNDLSGGTFTISNLGMFGIDHFHAIINPPESAILAVGRIIKTPVGMPDDSIALRPMMAMTLSIDHRSLDGMQGAQFLSLVKERLEQPYLIL